MKQPSGKNEYYKFRRLEDIFDAEGNPLNDKAWHELERMAYVVCNKFFHGRHAEVGFAVEDLAHIALLCGLLSARKACLRGLEMDAAWSLVFSGMRHGVANYLSRQKRRQEEPSEIAWRN